jgi:uncharacterized paraquat-inducible protein A
MKYKSKAARFVQNRYKDMACKNVYERYRATKDRRSSYYFQGYKRCQVCSTFLKWQGIRCPCCQRPLRSKPHNRKRRRIRRNQLENKN